MYLLWGVCCEKGEIGVDLWEWGGKWAEEMCEAFWKEKRGGFVMTQRRFHSHHPERLFQKNTSFSDPHLQTKCFSSLSPE